MHSHVIDIHRLDSTSLVAPLQGPGNIGRSTALRIDPLSQQLACAQPVQLTPHDGSRKPLCDLDGAPIIRPIRRDTRPGDSLPGLGHGPTTGWQIGRQAGILGIGLLSCAAFGGAAYVAARGVQQGAGASTDVVVGSPSTKVQSGMSAAVAAGLGAGSFAVLLKSMDIASAFVKHRRLTVPDSGRLKLAHLEAYLESADLSPDKRASLERIVGRLRFLNQCADEYRMPQAPVPFELLNQMVLVEHFAYDVVLGMPQQRMEISLFRTDEGRRLALRLIRAETADMLEEHRPQAAALLFHMGMRSLSFSTAKGGDALERGLINVVLVGTEGVLKSQLVRAITKLYGYPAPKQIAPPQEKGGASNFLSGKHDPLINAQFETNDLSLKGAVALEVYRSHMLNVVHDFTEFDLKNKDHVNVAKVVADPADGEIPIEGLGCSISNRDMFCIWQSNDMHDLPAPLIDRAHYLFRIDRTTDEVKLKSATAKSDDVGALYTRTPDVGAACLDPVLAHRFEAARGATLTLLVKRSKQSTQSARLCPAVAVTAHLAMEAIEHPDTFDNLESSRRLITSLYDARDQMIGPASHDAATQTHDT